MQKQPIRQVQGKKVIAIVGPTSSGKTALGIYLAQKLGGEVISGDSRQVYKGLDIGTGKVTNQEMAGVPHHLLNVVSPKKQFSADDFVRLASKKIEGIPTPIVVGGTGFYIDTLFGRMSYPNVAPNPRLRQRFDKEDVATLYALLKKKDPVRAKTIEPHHKRRLIRALEIAYTLGKNPVPQKNELYDVLWIGINPTIATLRKRIYTRLRQRMRSGMVAEAKRLHARGLSYKRMEELGLEYRYLARLLTKKLTVADFTNQLEREIVKYAKRQLRWFKRNKDIHWVASPGRTGKAEALRLAKAFLSR